MPGPPSHPKSARIVWYAPTRAMYAAASAINAKHARSPYIHGRAASAGPPETRAWTNPSFFFNDTATTEIYTLSLHDALPISDHRALHRAQAGHPHRDAQRRRA